MKLNVVKLKLIKLCALNYLIFLFFLSKTPTIPPKNLWILLPLARGTGDLSEICTLPPVLLKSSAVPSYHPRTTCSSREERRRGTKNPVKGCGGGRGSSPTQAVTMATVPSCCLLSLAHSLFQGSTCASGQAAKTLTHLDLPEE